MALRRTVPTPSPLQQLSYRPVRFSMQDLRDIDAALKELAPQYPQSEYITARETEMWWKTDEYKTDNVEDLKNYPSNTIKHLQVTRGTEIFITVTSSRTSLIYGKLHPHIEPVATKLRHIISSREISRPKHWLVTTGIWYFVTILILTNLALFIVRQNVPKDSSYFNAPTIGIFIVYGITLVCSPIFTRNPACIRVRAGSWIDQNKTVATVASTLLAALITSGAALIAARIAN